TQRWCGCSAHPPQPKNPQAQVVPCCVARKGSRPLLKLEEWMDIRTLRKEGHSIKAIARQTGRSRNTVRRVLREARPTAFKKPQRHSCLDAFKSYVQQRWEECGLSAIRLLAEILPMGYTGSV